MPRPTRKCDDKGVPYRAQRIPIEGEGVTGLELGVDHGWETALLSDPLAKKIVEKWVREGMYRDRLIDLLHSYCRPLDKRVLALFREEARERRKSIQKLIGAVKRLKAEIDRASKQDGMARLIREADDPRINLRYALQKYLDRLEDWENRFRRASSAKGSGRDDSALVTLVFDLCELTGKPHYGDVAYLVERGLAAYGSNRDLDAEVIKKRVKRFVRRNPTLDHPLDILSLLWGLGPLGSGHEKV